MPEQRRTDHLESLLRSGDWVDELSPVDLEALARSARRSPRRPAWASAAVVLLLGGAMVTGSLLGDREPVPPARSSHGSGEAVPWVDRTPAPPVAETVLACQADGLRVSLGRAGAWHGQAVQTVDVLNVSGHPCMFSAGDFSVTATTPQGRSVDVATSGQDAVTLEDGQVAYMGLGAPAGCGAEPVVARTLVVTADGTAAKRLTNAWLPLSCGGPTLIHVLAEATEPKTQSAPVTAAVDAPAVAVAGSTLHFTVTLTNTSPSASVTFAGCPSYYVGLKALGPHEVYELNCDVSPDLPAGHSRTYAMQLDVPPAAFGPELLVWGLDDYPAADSVPIRVTRASDQSSPSPDRSVTGVRVAVPSHCGVHSVMVEGRLWLADPPLGDHNPPSGWDENETAGTFVETSPSSAVFYGDNGQRAKFQRAPAGARDPNAGCE